MMDLVTPKGIVKAKRPYPPDNKLKESFPAEPVFPVGEGDKAYASYNINHCPLEKM